MPKRTSAASDSVYRVTIVTLDGHLAGAAHRAFDALATDDLKIAVTMHCAGEWQAKPELLKRCHDDIARADIVVACMLFLDDHIKAVLPALKARRDACDAMVCFMSDGDVIRLTRIGQFDMSGPTSAPMAMLKRLRGSKHKDSASSGEKQMAMLNRLPRILRFIPGTAQDVRAYFLAMQYWLAGSEQNIANMVRYLACRYRQVDGKHANRGVKVP
ncbi:MAG: DUF3479 domain-containing protein, partial [Pseudomonadota bacterium]